MSKQIRSIITGTGSYIPEKVVRNEDFLEWEFYGNNGEKLAKANQVIVDKFEAITTIAERRHVPGNLKTSDIATFAAQAAIQSAGIDPETLDYIIFAHNFGDIAQGKRELDIVPTLAARVKHQLKIANPYAVAYDLPFGCPGWVQGMIQANYYIKSGDAKKVLVIGAEVLSRVCDPHDRDSMIYADGAGAVLLEALETDEEVGILAHKTRSDTLDHAHMLFMGNSYNEDINPHTHFLKMYGRKLYQYALTNVPTAMQACLEKSGVPLANIKKILIHQANGKMDEAILQRFYKLYGEKAPEDVMPMTVSYLGNSSVATVPTLLDLILRDELKPHQIGKGDDIIFASVGAGMNINAIVYRWH